MLLVIRFERTNLFDISSERMGRDASIKRFTFTIGARNRVKQFKETG